MGSHTIPGEAPTKEFWIPVTAVFNGVMLAIGPYPCAILNADIETAYMSFHVPHDFTSLTEAVIVVIPTATQAAANWDLLTQYAANGEYHATNTENDTTSTYNVTNSELFEVNVSGVLTGIAVGDYVGVYLRQKTAGHNVNVLGLRIKYR